MRVKTICDEVVKWRKSKKFETNWDNMPIKLMLVVTELAEACEAHRNGDRKNFNEEIADTFIRLFDIAGSVDIDLEKEISDKMAINWGRSEKHGKLY